MRLPPLCRPFVASVTTVAFGTLLGAWPQAGYGHPVEEVPSAKRRPPAETGNPLPMLFRTELQLPDTLGVGQVTGDVVRDFPAVEALTGYLTDHRANESLYVRALPVLVRSRDEAVDFLKRGIADLVFTDPLETIHDGRASGATILLAQRRGDRPGYGTVVFVRDDSSARSLSDLAEERLAFGAGDSGTAFLAPLASLRQAGMRLSRLSGPAGEPPAGHAGYFVLPETVSTAKAISGRVATAGAMTAEEWEQEQVRGNTADLRILHTGPELPRSFVLAAPGMSSEQREAVRRTLLAMNENPAGRAVLERYGQMNGFDPIDEELRQQIDLAGRLYDLVQDEVR